MRQPSYRSPWSATTLLMIGLVVCFAVQNIVYFYVGWPLNEYLALSTSGLRRGFVWQLLTFQFLHGGLGHLLGNLLGLYFFGRTVESRLGARNFLKIYFLCGTAGGILQSALAWLVPNYFGGSVLGASAGVLGIVAVFALMEPEAQIFLNFFIPIRAKHLLWFELAVALFFTLVPTSAGVAHAAHLGGILMAIGYMRWDAQRATVPWNPIESRRRKRQLVQAAAKAVRWYPRSDAKPEVPAEEFISREVDPILDKISAHGIHSLTPREREILEAARSKMSKP